VFYRRTKYWYEFGCV